jgi:uncharacterized protein
MNLVLFGATGILGQRILAEALARGHNVTAAARHPTPVSSQSPNLCFQTADILNPARVAELAAGQDVVISAIGPGLGDARLITDAAKSLVSAFQRLPSVRLVVVGGAGSLEISPGVQMVDTPGFPAPWRVPALAHRDALAIYKASNIDWTYISPPAVIEPGQRTGRYRRGGDQLLKDDKGDSRISAEDFAVALLDEIEQPRSHRKRFTVAY